MGSSASSTASFGLGAVLSSGGSTAEKSTGTTSGFPAVRSEEYAQTQNDNIWKEGLFVDKETHMPIFPRLHMKRCYRGGSGIGEIEGIGHQFIATKVMFEKSEWDAHHFYESGYRLEKLDWNAPGTTCSTWEGGFGPGSSLSGCDYDGIKYLMETNGSYDPLKNNCAHATDRVMERCGNRREAHFRGINLDESTLPIFLGLKKESRLKPHIFAYENFMADPLKSEK